MGKRTIVDSLVGFIDSIAPDSKDFWAPMQNKGPQRINLTQVNNYYVLENGNKRLVSREHVSEQGELIDIES